MISSMTAFAHLETSTAFGHLTCDMRSVNHRYLEISMRLPELLSSSEMSLRELIHKKMQRGKIDCTIRFESKQAAAFMVNTELVQEIIRIADEMSHSLKNSAAVSPLDILNFPGVLLAQTIDASALQETVLPLCHETADLLLKTRAREGEKLYQLLFDKMHSLQAQMVVIKQRGPLVLQQTRHNLLARFKDLSLTLDANRLEQEMVLLTQKMDIAEEMDRLYLHVDEMKRVLEEGGVVGRRLDFLLQELNREANTLGAKSGDVVLTHAVVEIKVLLEQIREQVQNIV